MAELALLLHEYRYQVYRMCGTLSKYDNHHINTHMCTNIQTKHTHTSIHIYTHVHTIKNDQINVNSLNTQELNVGAILYTKRWSTVHEKGAKFISREEKRTQIVIFFGFLVLHQQTFKYLAKTVSTIYMLKSHPRFCIAAIDDILHNPFSSFFPFFFFFAKNKAENKNKRKTKKSIKNDIKSHDSCFSFVSRRWLLQTLLTIIAIINIKMRITTDVTVNYC